MIEETNAPASGGDAVIDRDRGPLFALYAANAVSMTGNVAALIAIPWFVLQETGSAALTGLSGFFAFLPIVFAAFFGGVVVDRLGFRTSSVVADLTSAAAVAAIPLLHTTVGIEICASALVRSPEASTASS